MQREEPSFLSYSWWAFDDKTTVPDPAHLVPEDQVPQDSGALGYDPSVPLRAPLEHEDSVCNEARANVSLQLVTRPASRNSHRTWETTLWIVLYTAWTNFSPCFTEGDM